MSNFIDPTQYKPLMYLRDHWEVMRDECAALDRTDILDIDREAKSHDEVAAALIKNGKPQWVKAWGNQKDKWLNWGFVIKDEVIFNDPRTAKTTALLRKVKGFKVAALSLFRPGVSLPVHNHPELSYDHLLTFHLGLECPRHCYLSADGQFTTEKNGQAIVFDGSKPHFATNASLSDRLILYCEFSPARLRLEEEST